MRPGAARRVACVEPDPALRARLLADGFPCSDSLADLAPGSMPFAYTVNVLEHIAADDAAARALYEVLRPGGRLLVYVPAFNLLYSSMDRRV